MNVLSFMGCLSPEEKRALIEEAVREATTGYKRELFLEIRKKLSSVAKQELLGLLQWDLSKELSMTKNNSIKLLQIKDGFKITGIKKLRELFYLGLIDAKGIVDTLPKTIPVDPDKIIIFTEELKSAGFTIE